jgi:hypothetical protein
MGRVLLFVDPNAGTVGLSTWGAPTRESSRSTPTQVASSTSDQSLLSLAIQLEPFAILWELNSPVQNTANMALEVLNHRPSDDVCSKPCRRALARYVSTLFYQRLVDHESSVHLCLLLYSVRVVCGTALVNSPRTHRMQPASVTSSSRGPIVTRVRMVNVVSTVPAMATGIASVNLAGYLLRATFLPPTVPLSVVNPAAQLQSDPICHIPGMQQAPSLQVDSIPSWNVVSSYCDALRRRCGGRILPRP